MGWDSCGRCGKAKDPAGCPQDVGHACVSTGRRGFSMPTFLSSHLTEREHPGVVIN